MKKYIIIIMVIFIPMTMFSQPGGMVIPSQTGIGQGMANRGNRVSITKENSDFGFRNPVITGMAPDPSICRKGNDFFLINSSFCHYPGIPIYHSIDLIHWDLIGYCCTEENGFEVSGSGIFAPTIRYNEIEDTFYVVCTNGGKLFITYTSDPYGKWSDLNYIQNVNARMDPSLFFDSNGKCYITGNGGGGILIAEINPKTGEVIEKERTLWTGAGGRSTEGSHLYLINNIYYLMVSEGGTEYGHHVIVARSNNPYGPWEEYSGNPILTQIPSIAQSGIMAVGHSDIIQASDGSWWMVFLATRPQNNYYYHMARETFLLPMQWSRDNWPIVNSNGTASLDVLTRTLKQTDAISTDFNCEFDSKEFPLEFNWYNKPVWDNYVVSNGQLLMKGGDGRSTFIGIRQKDFISTTETCIEFNPKEGEEAGICVRNDINRGHYEIGVTSENGKRYVIRRFQFGQNANFVKKTEIPGNGKVFLKICSTRAQYDMQYSFDGITWESLGTIDSNYLSGGFSGLLVGLYQYGKGEQTSKFDYLKYTGEDELSL